MSFEKTFFWNWASGQVVVIFLSTYVWCPLYRHSHFDTSGWGGVQRRSGWEPHLLPLARHLHVGPGARTAQRKMRLPSREPHILSHSRHVQVEKEGNMRLQNWEPRIICHPSRPGIEMYISIERERLMLPAWERHILANPMYRNVHSDTDDTHMLTNLSQILLGTLCAFVDTIMTDIAWHGVCDLWQTQQIALGTLNNIQNDNRYITISWLMQNEV